MNGNGEKLQNPPQYKLRIQFSKMGNAVYISHLDMLRTFTRAIRRAGLPAAYSQGFNPHMLLTFSMPLSLGTASLAEFADLRLTQPVDFTEAQQALTGVMPKDIGIVCVTEANPPLSEIVSSQYTIAFEGAKQPETLQALGEEVLSRPSLIIEKKTKRSVKETDILPLILEKSWKVSDKTLLLRVRVLSGGEKTLNPNLLVHAIQTYQPAFRPLSFQITKTAVYRADGSEFVQQV